MGADFKLLRKALAFGRGFFGPLGQNKAFHAVCAYLSYFWCSVVTSSRFSNNLGSFENYPKQIIKKTIRSE